MFSEVVTPDPGGCCPSVTGNKQRGLVELVYCSPEKRSKMLDLLTFSFSADGRTGKFQTYITHHMNLFFLSYVCSSQQVWLSCPSHIVGLYVVALSAVAALSHPWCEVW